MKTKEAVHADFWMEGNYNSEIDSSDPMVLASHRRAISNFVTILTGKFIPVQYKSLGDSASTTGDKIFISGKLSRESYDSAVGTALHEAAHILLSDFTLVRMIERHIPPEVMDMGIRCGIPSPEICMFVKSMWNYVEDRFIDHWVFTNAPGYREYYRAMYRTYWNSAKVSKGLMSMNYRDETLDSYETRIINLTNPKTDLDALRGLRKIASVIDLPNISRLAEPSDRFEVACEVSEFVFKCTMNNNLGKTNFFSLFPDGSAPTGSSGNSDEEEDEWPSKFDLDEQRKLSEDTSSIDELLGGVINELFNDKADEGYIINNEYKDDQLTAQDKAACDEAIEDQKSFLHGNINKDPISKEMSDALKDIEESKTAIVRVGDDYNGNFTGITTDCVFVGKMTRYLFNCGNFPFKMHTNLYHSDVIAGISLGKRLGKKLKVRGESRVTKFTRKEAGTIDKRLISELGFDNQSIFSREETEVYRRARLHISLDASCSMDGASKWKRALTTTVAICKAVSMTENIEVVVSLRSTDKNEKAYVAIVYDSKVDSFRRVLEYFPFLGPSGTTPEGLAFQAISDSIPPSDYTTDSYFLNISDGMPWYTNGGIRYEGQMALKHTRNQVNKMRERGIKVVSYFVGSGESNTSRYQNDSQQFQVMYGRDAKMIDVTDMSQIAATMNKAFLQKE